jgi:hypothetical protein
MLGSEGVPLRRGPSRSLLSRCTFYRSASLKRSFFRELAESELRHADRDFSLSENTIFIAYVSGYIMLAFSRDHHELDRIRACFHGGPKSVTSN